MTIPKYQVFLASRFYEFQELRDVLKRYLAGVRYPPVDVIDLSDNEAQSNPPLDRCYNKIGQSDLFVLLIGESYGDPLEGHHESYTHLEYRYALKDKITILPFVIGKQVRPTPELRQVEHNALKKWLAEVERHHTPGYHCSAVGVDHLGSIIFEQVRERLVELFLDTENRDELNDDTEIVVEEPLFKRDQLADSPELSPNGERGPQPLRELARSHAREALRALQLNVPRVAIQHLRKAFDLVPLDVILGYWLARLLIATGERKNCLEAKKTALLCARIASTPEGEHKLEVMACFVLAARASERLGKLEDAHDFAKIAHDKLEHHWLAKIEYARQLALKKQKAQAFELAEAAFWLRPDSIHRIHAEPAFRAFGDGYEAFRSKLKQTLIQRARALVELENEIFDFAGSLQLDGPPTKAQIQPVDSTNSLGQLVKRCRLSLKSSFQALRLSAWRLSNELDSFTFITERGLTPDTKLLIEESLRAHQQENDELTQRHQSAEAAARRFADQRISLITISVLIGLGSGVLILVLVSLNYFVAAFLLFVASGLPALIIWTKFQNLGEAHSHNQENARSLSVTLSNAKHELEKVSSALSDFSLREQRLRQNLTKFIELTDRFESKGLKTVGLSPVPPIDRKGKREVAKADAAKILQLKLESDDQLLPERMRLVWPSSPPKAKFWLIRFSKAAGEPHRVSRSAAYFEPQNAIYIHKEGIQSGPFTFLQFAQKVQAGEEFQQSDLIWFDTDSGWLPVRSFLNFFT